MAKTEDILNMLRQLSETQTNRGKMGMDAARYQGEQFNRVGDRFNEMVDTWVARGEAKTKRDFDDEQAGNERGFKASERAASEGYADRATESERKWQEEKYWPFMKSLEALKNRGGTSKEDDPNFFNSIQAFKDVAEMVNAYDGMVFDYNVLKANKGKVLAQLDAILQDRVDKNIMDSREKERWIKQYNMMIDDEVVPDDGGGDEVAPLPRQTYNPALDSARYDRWKRAGRPTQAGTRGGFTAQEIADFLQRDLPEGTY